MLVCIAHNAMGRIIVDPVQLSLVFEVAPPGKMGAYIGFSIIAFAVGGSLGSALGGAIYDLSQGLGFPLLTWPVMRALGIAGALGMPRIRRWFVQ